MNYKLTYEDALQIAEAYKNFNFSKSEYMIEGYRLVTFTYFLCGFEDFEKPLKNRPEVHAYDMRGVTFVFNLDGSLYKRFLMLPKFFNLNQVPTTQYGELKDKFIKSVTVKEDGSLIAFMQLPNGNVFAKTQGGFDNEQCKAAMSIYNKDEKIKTFVLDMLEKDCTPLFEYVAFDNRIVLQYKGRELRLIGVRDNNDQFYLNAPGVADWIGLDIPYIKSVGIHNLDELVALSKTEKDIEGWVVEYDHLMVKIKTQWYFNLHGIRTENIFREDYVIRNYLEGTLDDLVSQLNEKEDADAFKFVSIVKLAVDNKLKDIDQKVKSLYDTYITMPVVNWPKFASQYNREPYFRLVKCMIDKPEEFDKRKVEYIINQNKKLQDAKFFVSKWSGVTEKIVSKWNRTK